MVVTRCFESKVLLLALVLISSFPSLPAQTLNLPPRPANAPTGSQFINIISPMSLTERENWIYAQALSGNVPNFLRTLVPITVSGTIGGTPHTVTYCVIPDYLAIGTDADYFLEPMTPLLAQRICDAIGCTLPTRKMVNQIWTNASVKLNPQPIAPSAEMITVPVFADHNTMVRTQRNSFTNSFPLGALVSGDKKDVVISTLIYSNLHTNVPKPVVIYGWHYTTGAPIQPLYNGHEETYADYSHGARLVQNAITLDGSPNTVTNVLTQASLAGLLSDESASESTTAGVIQTPRYSITNIPPFLITPPRSQTVFPGANISFNALAFGTAPLGFRWQSNGVFLGATNSALLLTNVQAAAAPNYAFIATNAFGSVTSRPAVLRVSTNLHPILFGDDFEADTSSAWNLFWGASNAIPDYTVDWAFDCGSTPYTFNGVTALIPPAPNSPDGSTRAVRLTVNNNDTNGSIAGVNIYPKGQVFSNNFALKADVWINYPGGIAGAGSTGSTEHAIFGINHKGTQVNWAAPASTSSDGLFFAGDGEGGTSRDYRAYVGNPAGSPAELIGTSASGLAESNNAAAVYQTLFPASRFETAGSSGKHWVEFELRQTNNNVLWLMDGTVIAQRTNSSSFRSGNIMLGFMDLFASIANPAENAFVLFDNVRVEDLSGGIRFLSASFQTNHQFTLVSSAIPGRTHYLEASTNLADWEIVSTKTATNAPIAWVDSGSSLFTWRFYRVR